MQLAARTVGRDEVLAILDRRLRAVATSAHRPHTLLVGPRGSGKTHLVEVALYQAGKHQDFRQRVHVVRFDEDMVGIGSYRDVLREILSRLSIASGGQLVRQPTDAEAAIARALGDRALVLVIENLDKLFHALGTSGQQDLRAWVETSRSIMLLATTPTLFPGVQDRRQPWYGNFGIIHLEELGVDDGAALLSHIAHERGDDELADFLHTERGLARLRAINQLAGGSPRIWMILSDCISVELLDELVPAVEALLEGLVPYYQQLLWDLSSQEQRLVRALADGSAQAMTVSMLAEETGVEQRSAATSLGRLARERWVRAEKPGNLDQRTTWYRLREPLLRHHLHYRSAKDQPLPLIVDLLRAWFEPGELRTHLLGVEPGAPSEFLLATSLSRDPHRFDSAYADRDVDALLVDARRWITGADPLSRTPEAGALIEFGVLLARNGAEIARTTLETRVAAGAGANLLPAQPIELPDDAEDADRVGVALAAVAGGASGRTHDVLELISACWDGNANAAVARDRLTALSALAVSNDDPLTLDIRHEAAYWSGQAGDPVAARELFAAVVPDRVRVLGADHPDSLATRLSLAYWSGKAGDPVAARDQFAALVPDRVRVLGADHPGTLSIRHHLTYWTDEAGDPVAAREELAALVPDLVRVLGADHPETLSARYGLAYLTGEAGDPVAARDQFAALVRDLVRGLGADHPDTLSARYGLASRTGRAGDPAAAREQFAALVPDMVRVLGADHPDTLSSRHNLAYWTGGAGEPTAAAEQLLSVYTDRSRILGPESEPAIRTHIAMLSWLSKSGHAAEAAQRLLSLSTSQAVSDRSALRTAAESALGEVLLDFLDQAARDVASPIDDNLPGAAFLADLQAAVMGEPAALARIPTELVSIVTEVRERHHGSTATRAGIDDQGAGLTE